MKLWETSSHSTDDLVERFTSGEDVQLDAKLLYYDLCGTMAHVVGLGHIGFFSNDEVTQIRLALQTLWDQALQIRPEDEDVHTAVENALNAELGDIGQNIHTGRSRNDQILVDLKLYTKSALLHIITNALDLAHFLLKFAQTYEFVPMPGSTHTRWAMPSSIGLWAGSFVEGIFESLVSIDAAYRLVDRSPLGAAAGYGVPLPLEREFVAQLLGFSGVQSNTLNAISSRGKLDHVVLSALSALMLDLNRLATDLIWSSSETMPFFELPEAFCTGSSIMPNKQNPDVLELVRAKATRVQAHASQAFMLAQGNISGYHRDHQELKPPLIDGLETTIACLTILTALIQDLKLNESAFNDSMASELFAVDQMIEKVKAGTPLRQAYREVKADLGQVRIPNIERALKARSHEGGTGNLGLGDLKEQLQQQRIHWDDLAQNFHEALDNLIQIKKDK